MSYTQIFKFKKNGDSEEFSEIKNSFRGAMAIWNILDEKYLTRYIPEFTKAFGDENRIYHRSCDPKGEAIKEVWKLNNNKEVTKTDKICLRSTFDNVIVMRKDIPELLSAFRSFEGECSLKEQAKAIEDELRLDTDLVAIGWNQTSVNCGWYSEDSTDEETLPYNIFKSNKHWDLFSDEF